MPVALPAWMCGAGSVSTYGSFAQRETCHTKSLPLNAGCTAPMSAGSSAEYASRPSSSWRRSRRHSRLGRPDCWGRPSGLRPTSFQSGRARTRCKPNRMTCGRSVSALEGRSRDSHVGSNRCEGLMPEVKKARAIGFNHIALEVGDIDKALAFYAGIFRRHRGQTRRRSCRRVPPFLLLLQTLDLPSSCRECVLDRA
jgi:hypothetical protein